MDQLIKINEDERSETKRTWRIFLIVFSALITPSPIFLNYGPFKGNIYYLLSSLLIILFTFTFLRINKTYIIICGITLMLQALGIVYWSEIKLLVFPLYTYTAWLVVFSLRKQDIHLFVHFSSIFILVLLIGGMIGFFYAFAGGTELFSIVNEDTRLNGFYLGTFSNSYLGKIIRPSGIYDEPGALSFVTCFLAAVRSTLNFSRKTTWIILILGFATFSAAHFIYVIFHLLQEMRKWKLKQMIIFIVIILFGTVAIGLSVFGSLFYEFLFWRFEVDDGQFAGDNRSGLIINAYNYLNLNVFLFGLDVDCIVRPAICQMKGYNQFGDNPLGPIVWGGITMTFPYYLVVFYYLITGIQKINFMCLGLFFLLLLRAEVMSYGYALLIALVTFTIINKKKLLISNG